MRPRHALAAAVCVAGLVSCGQSPAPGTAALATPTPSAAVPSLPAATYVGELTTPRTYREAGISLDVPAVSGTLVPWSKAYESCLSGDAICSPDSGPSIALASAKVSNSGTQRTDGSITPLVDGRLVYVLTWTDKQCVPKGGPPLIANAASASPQTFKCTLLDLVDAHTGAVLFSVEGNQLS